MIAWSHSTDARRFATRAALWPLWLAAIALPALLFMGGAWWSWRSVQAEAVERLERTVAVLHEHALRAFETQDILLEAVERATRGLDWAEIARSEELAAHLRDLQRATGGRGGIGMVDPQGNQVQVSSAPFPPPAVQLLDRDYVRAQANPAAAGPFVGEPIVTRVGGLSVIPYSRPRRGPDDWPDGGTLWATLRVNELTRHYEHLLQHPGDVVLFVRSDGRTLLRHPSLPRDAAPARQQVDPGSLSRLQQATASAAAVGRIAIVRERSPSDGIERLYGLRHLPLVPVVVIYGQHPDGPRQIWLWRLQTLGAVSAAASLLLLGLTGVASRRLRRAAEAHSAAEARLRQSERLTVMGQLTAGVAHDVRNMALSVQSGTSLIRQALARGESDRADALLGMLNEAAGRTASLTDRMMRAARRGREESGENPTLNVAEALKEAAGLLSAALGASWPVTVDPIPAGLPCRVRGDAAEFEAALLNLALNARDAMPAGGTIRLAVAPERVDEGDLHPAELVPGAYARISVIDAGIGMDRRTLQRAADAFFTTKPAGRGTGLGLSSVGAFVRGAGGGLLLDSAGPGLGTTVFLWLPEADPPLLRPVEDQPAPAERSPSPQDGAPSR
ncbi:MAG: hypothetical protein K2X11_14225 [Acetobacteraceae bacterium]|nr:hypothetical protein [Acetobacteraceae bacterium]